MRKLVVALLLSMLSASAAQAIPGSSARVDVNLSNFQFAPSTMHLRAGVPVVLRLQNSASGGHNFSAPQFFAAAKIDPASTAHVVNGAVEVPKHGVVEVALVPSAGRYPLKCTHSLHAAFGMKGTILVD